MEIIKPTEVLVVEYTTNILDYNTNQVIKSLHYPHHNEVNYPIIPNIDDIITLWKGKYKVKKVEREINLLNEWEHDYITVYVEKISNHLI